MNSLGINKAKKETRVVVAMSGGVDSSVVAALMKEEGYDVKGITLKLYDDSKMSKEGRQCCAGQDIMDAKRVSEKINIKHEILYYQKKFKSEVIDSFIDSYTAGETPIPCVQCNQTVKFRDLFKYAKEKHFERVLRRFYDFISKSKIWVCALYYPPRQTKERPIFKYSYIIKIIY